MLTSYIYDAVRTPFGRYGKGSLGCARTTSPPS